MENVPNAPSEINNQEKIRAYRMVCAKLGIAMCVYFICRYFVGFLLGLIFRTAPSMSETLHVIFHYSIIVIFVYIVPLLVTALIFGSFKLYKGKFVSLYKKPKRLARSLGAFPAMYGLGHGTALLTLLIAFLIARFSGGQTLIEELLRPTAVEATTSIASLIAMVFMLVVVAPVIEEIWVRGIMYDALKPYGVGVAILISSLLFGIMHGSLYMLFYTTAYGLALGYIRYATDSLLIVTILHAIVNGIAAVILVLLSVTEMTVTHSRALTTSLNLFLVAVLVAIIIGVITFFAKIPKIRKYKFENQWSQVGGGKKVALFFVSVPVLVMLLFAANEFAGGRPLSAVVDIFGS